MRLNGPLPEPHASLRFFCSSESPAYWKMSDASWENDEAMGKASAWTRARDAPPARARGSEARKISEMNKRLKAIYEDEDREYGADATDVDTIVDRFKVATNLRKNRIGEVFREIRRCRNVELCFLVDVTGSMQPHIDGVRNSIHEIVSKLTDTRSHVCFQDAPAEAQTMSLSFVGYRDHNDKKRLELFRFTQSVEEFKAFCRGLTATGGDDECEDVFGGLNAALGLNWSANAGTKVIFHICDAPCHGKEFYDRANDSYPSGDPKGLTHTALFSRLRELGIQYHFGKINSSTEKMIRVFSTAYGDQITDFDIKKVENIKQTVVTAVTMSIAACVAKSKHTVGADRKERHFVIDKSEPNWQMVATQPVKLISYPFPDSIKSVIDDYPLIRSEPTTTKVKIATSPFAKGAERLAFYGMDLTNNEQLVIKEYLHTGKGLDSAKRYELANQMQTIAAFLAEEYVKELTRMTGVAKIIRFVKIKTLLAPKNGGYRCLSAERRFSTNKFVRFTNNVDYAIVEEKAKSLGIEADFVQLVIAFSHWTYKVTKRYLMVVDLEGVVEREGHGRVVLTDPAIHCMDVTRFGNMNHGQKGMEGFFRRHDCNKFCRMLNLEHFVPNA